MRSALLLAYYGTLLTVSCAPVPGSLPVVDLGYELHQAIAYNDTGNYYNFSNVRYAAPPLGNLRFRAPKAPANNRKTIQTGANAKVCPQGATSWGTFPWVNQYLAGESLNLTQATVNAVNASITTADVPDSAFDNSEDCLFLDVMVPKHLFDERAHSGAPVMVWIFGGGYVLGSKTSWGNPAGLVERSLTHGRDGIIYVSINYRLGAFGWLAGPTLQADGTANAGLYDQRFALEWVQQYIHLFGGDPSRVTVFGESAGGGSIVHQITAYGGKQGAPFHQAITQSPGYFPQTSNYALESQLNEFLNLLGVSTIEEARKLPSKALLAANYVQVWQSYFGQFTYGPAVDGDFVPDWPGKLLAQGDHADVRVMTGQNLDEGLIFVNPLVQTDADLQVYLSTLLPDAQAATVNYIAETLYPPVYTGEYSYNDSISRSALLLSELVFTCNNIWLDHAFNDKTYSYYFTVPPALHGRDLAYTFYNNDPASAAVVNTTAAVILQDWLVTYAESGTPSTPDIPGAPPFVMNGADETVEKLGLDSITHTTNPAANARCLWWQKALFE